MIMDADNLAVRERIQLSENLAGRSIFNSDESIMYSISDSGVMVLPMSCIEKARRVIASQEDVVFRGTFCNAGAVTQQIDVVDPSGNATPFEICLAGSSSCSAPGVTISPSQAVTPARVKITIDGTTVRSLLGT